MSDVSTNTLQKVSLRLEDSIANLSWLLRMLASRFPGPGKGNEDEDGDAHLGLPPISATISPSLCFIWEQELKLRKGSHRGKVAAAAIIVLLARDNDHFRKVIIEEGGVVPLVNLLREKDGPIDARESAAYALGLFASDAEKAEAVIQSCDICSVFTEVLKQGPIKVQAMVAWAISELAKHYPDCQDTFAQNGSISLLVAHLVSEIPSPSIHPTEASEDDQTDRSKIYHPLVNHEQQFVLHPLATEPGWSYDSTVCNCLPPDQGDLTYSEMQEVMDPVLRARMNAMAARALSNLIKGNSVVCKNLIESSHVLPCLIQHLEKGTGEVRYNSAVALMEVSRIVDRDADVRQAFVKANPSAIRTMVDILVSIVEGSKHPNHLLLCGIATLGCLSKAFEMTENHIIGQLVHLLDDGNAEVMYESAVALTKFTEPDNRLHLKNCKAIIDEGGVRHLVQLGYLGELAQLPALLVLCYIAKHLPHDAELIQADVLAVLLWASMQNHVVKDRTLEQLLQEAISIVKIYKT